MIWPSFSSCALRPRPIFVLDTGRVLQCEGCLGHECSFAKHPARAVTLHINTASNGRGNPPARGKLFVAASLRLRRCEASAQSRALPGFDKLQPGRAASGRLASPFHCPAIDRDSIRAREPRAITVIGIRNSMSEGRFKKSSCSAMPSATATWFSLISTSESVSMLHFDGNRNRRQQFGQQIRQTDGLASTGESRGHRP